jgi:hypothetical protein
MRRSILENGIPARLTTEETAKCLGFSPVAVDHLVNEGLLRELGGHPPRGVQRMFSAAYIEELWADQQWLAKATRSVRKYFADRNASYKAQRAAASTLTDGDREAGFRNGRVEKVGQ